MANDQGQTTNDQYVVPDLARRTISEGALMNVEYTGRHYEITSTIRQEVETGLTKIRKILGDRFETKATPPLENHPHKPKLTTLPPNQPPPGPPHPTHT